MQHDDVEQIMHDIIECDCIVLATPMVQAIYIEARGDYQTWNLTYNRLYSSCY